MPSSRTRLRAPWLAWATPLVVVAALGLGACTTSQWDTSTADHPTTTGAKTYPNTEAGFVESLTDHLSTVGPDLNQWAPPRDEARCAAIKVVARLGVNRMLDLGFQADKGSLVLPYTDDERTSLTNILVGCIRFDQGVLSLVSSYQKLAVLPAECVTDGIHRQGLDQAFAAALLAGDQPDPFAHNDQLGAGLGVLLAQCLTPTSDLVPGAPVVRFPSEIYGTSTTDPGVIPTTTTPDTTPTSGN